MIVANFYDLKDNRIEKIYPDRIINSLYFDNLEFQIFNDSEESNS